MVVFTSVWVVFLLYCTNWPGIQLCFAVPVPTLSNYHGYYSKNSWNYRQTRYPQITYEKFVFPSKQQESVPVVAERSGIREENSGKIFFPDEIPPPANDKQYHFAGDGDGEVAPPNRKMNRHRPSAAVSSNPSKWTSLDETENSKSSEDGSIRMESPTTTTEKQQQLYSDINTKLDEIRKLSEEERIQEAVQEFYKWLKLSKVRQKNPQKNTTKCPDQFQTGSSSSSTSSVTNSESANSKPVSVISDQSLVAGLKDQKCPEGQIRLENGECRVKLAI